jgi:alpha-glucoside transport system substrate-binding protein
VAAALAVAAAAVACSGSGEPSGREVVEVFGPVVEEPGTVLAETLRDASADSPVELRYVGVTSFNEQLDDRLSRGDRPGVVLLPQPGLLEDLVARGVLTPLPPEVASAAGEQFPERLVDLVGPGGVPAAVWLTVDVKGLVWYRPDELAARDLGLPGTLDELGELSERIRTAEDGVAPWCLTMEAGASTGWVGSDWVEDYVLRRLGPATYLRWTSGDLRFDSPQIAGVFEELDALLRRPGAVAGGQRAILTVPWERTAALLLEGEPSCLMAHQADFLRRELPAGTAVGPDGDVDFFALPGDRPDSRPLLVGGMLAAPLGTGDAVAAAMALLATADLAERLDATGQFLSPHLALQRDATATPISRRLLELVGDATEIHFDGSDLMPGAVGTGTFWTGMSTFFAGEEIGAVLTDIDSGWPVPPTG